MDFLNLSTELSSREEFNRNSETTLRSICNFFSELYKNYAQFSTNIHNAIEVLFNNLLKFDNKSSYSKMYFEFYRSFDKYLDKLHSISSKIKKELLEPTELIITHLRVKNITELKELKDIITTSIDQKKKYEITKHAYFDACKYKETQEKKIGSAINESNPQSQSVEEECKLFKEEHKKMNDLFEQNDKKYFPLIDRLKNNEESRITFITYHFEKLKNILIDQNDAFNTMMSTLKESVVQVKVEDDMKLYEERFSYVYKNKQRFLRENFIIFEAYRKNLETMIQYNSKIIKQGGYPIQFPSIDLSFDPKSFNKIPLDRNDEIVFSSLFSSIEPEKKNIVSFENKLKTDEIFAKRVIDKLLIFFKVKNYYKFDKFKKFELLSSFLIDVCMNIQVQQKLFDLNFAIVFIGEKTFYYNKDESNVKNNKVYMSKYLSDNYQNFKSKIFWMRLLKTKITTAIDEYQKEAKDKNKQNKKNVFAIASFLFSGNNNNENKEEKEINEFKIKQAFNVIKTFIPHFTNFNLDMTSCNDIIIEVANEYNLTQEQISFFVSYLNSNMYTIKSNKILGEKKDNSNSNMTFKNYLIKKKIKNNVNKELKKAAIILTSSYNFLNIKEYIHIIRLNKLNHNYSQKKIYKQLLLSENSNLTFEQHSQIWKYLVKYNPNIFLYDKISNESKTFSNNVIDLIKLDVHRTPIDSNKEETKKKLEKILIAITYQFQSIGYCQGMHFICNFFLSMTQNENETFQNLSALLLKTDYSNIILNDFELMNKYFYVFERLIALYLPELHMIFRKNNISTSFYISPWLITLFTNSYSFLPANQSPKTLIRIFDLFALDGWYAILRVGLCMLKHFEKDIMQMQFEQLLSFLINDIVKFDFFRVSNYDKFVQLYDDMILQKGLIGNLENEYEIERKIKGSKNKEEKIKLEKDSENNI